ncbi:hypothetical protein LCGC14_0574410 [marine sediment metagenome]|uniref:Uncharacterized protein n=1 Tax=marine sediment metagenome TaxID=412755 RepID=A0A0F9RNC1_9ZZZZ
MDRFERENTILKIRQDVDILLENRDIIEANCGQLVCEKDSCEDCIVHYKLGFIEKEVSRLREKADDLLIKCDTWSYTIMGNRRAGWLWSRLFDIMFRTLKDEEIDQYPHKLPDGLIKEAIERNYKRLVCFTNSQISRLAYQVLEVFLMKYGARMTEDVRKRILEFSSWEDEEEQLIYKREWEERKLYLFDFREKVKKYKEGVKTTVPIESINDVMDRYKDNFFFERDSINYGIKI